MSGPGAVVTVPRPRAAYQSPLRARMKEQTALIILEAVAAVTRQSGLAAVSIAEVARVAEVTEQTIYRHYQTRDDLVAAFIKWHIELTAGAPDAALPETIDALLAWLASRYRAWARDRRIVAEAYMTPVGRALRKPLYALGYQNLITLLGREHPELADDKRAALAAAMLSLMSAENFAFLQENLGYDHQAVHRTVVSAINALRAGAAAE
jgi:AcrR family transcriptional regulator